MPLQSDVERILYPESRAKDFGYLQVSDLHEIYWETHGNPKGRPVVCLHGGPGSGMSSWHARIFNPEDYYIILFDQRGCGQSRPFSELRENTTPHLVADMEALRTFLGIKSWSIFGGSWGATLALAYADQYAAFVDGMVLYGIFLCRQKELDATFGPGGPAAMLYPDHYDYFLEPLTGPERQDPVPSYKKLFLSKDPEERQNAIRRWSHWELRILSPTPDEEMFSPENEDMNLLATHALFEHTYFMNHGFIDGDNILTSIGDKLANKSLHIIQGRYDLVCPPLTAYELHRAVPQSTISFIQTAGHSGKELETMKEILSATAHL